MSKNCIHCVVKPRTGPDLLCDECRTTPRKYFNPTTPEDHLANCEYAKVQLTRWVDLMIAWPNDAGAMHSAQNWLDELKRSTHALSVARNAQAQLGVAG